MKAFDWNFLIKFKTVGFGDYKTNLLPDIFIDVFLQNFERNC